VSGCGIPVLAQFFKKVPKQDPCTTCVRTHVCFCDARANIAKTVKLSKKEQVHEVSKVFSNYCLRIRQLLIPLKSQCVMSTVNTMLIKDNVKDKTVDNSEKLEM